MRQSRAFIATLRENPKDADVVSHQLMARSGMLRKHAAGIYSYLPLMVRSYHKLTQIMREEFDRVAWQEVIMPFVVPGELWKESGRWQAYGKEMARLKDRKDNDFCLGPTHEEVVTDLVRSQVTSWKQLPVTLYQITPKFRDETRPRFGVMRGREFVMMDGYSFHVSTADLDKHYEEVDGAYRRIFERAGLKFVRVEADTGAIGGSGSHEFHVMAQSGEDAILSCAACAYGANTEKAETPLPETQKRDFGLTTSHKPEDVSTPTQKTIDEVSKFLNVPAWRNVKTLVYRYTTFEEPREWKPVVIFTLGHRELNLVKLKNEIVKSGKNVQNLDAMPEADVAILFGCEVGFLGPINAPHCLTFFDREILGAHDCVSGANRSGFHTKHLEPARDFLPKGAALPDLGLAVAGDVCPRCAKGRLEESRGIEVGHIFKLGTKYSKAMNAVFQTDEKSSKVIEMGCYGIGVTRVLAACIEQNHDADGIVWPEALAPYKVHLISLAPEDKLVAQVADEFYDEMKARNIEVLYDDREGSPGVKFKDADLLGLPRRLVVGKKGLEKGEIEYVARRGREKRIVNFSDRNFARIINELLA